MGSDVSSDVQKAGGLLEASGARLCAAWRLTTWGISLHLYLYMGTSTK